MEGLKEFTERVLQESSGGRAFAPDEMAVLRWLERQTHTRTNHAQMLVGEEEGSFLKAFTQKVAQEMICSAHPDIPPKKIHILEIGTFTGYSLLCFSFALKGLGKSLPVKADALEINDELKYLIDEAIAKGDVKDFAEVHFTDAVPYLKSLAADHHNTDNPLYDIVFIDANKRNYLEYYELVFPLVKPGGYILADNVTWYGKAENSNASQAKDAKTEGIREFNERIAEESENGKIESFLLPLRDGLYIIRKTGV